MKHYVVYNFQQQWQVYWPVLMDHESQLFSSCTWKFLKHTTFPHLLSEAIGSVFKSKIQFIHCNQQETNTNRRSHLVVRGPRPLAEVLIATAILIAGSNPPQAWDTTRWSIVLQKSRNVYEGTKSCHVTVDAQIFWWSLKVYTTFENFWTFIFVSTEPPNVIVIKISREFIKIHKKLCETQMTASFKNSSMELAVIWGNFSCSDMACSDLAHSDLAHSDLAGFFSKFLLFHSIFTTWEHI